MPQRTPDQREEIKWFVVRVVLYVTLLCSVVTALEVWFSGWGILVAVICGPALLITSIKSWRALRRDRPMQTDEKIAAFIFYAGSMVVLIPVVIIAVAVAIFAICIGIASTGGFRIAP